MGRQDPFGAAGQDAGQAPGQDFCRFVQVSRQHGHQPVGEIAAGEVVHAAIAFGLADEGHDLVRADLAAVDQGRQGRDIAGVVH